ncbi:MAG: PEP-CTERM-box response regulator transcription factor [Gammaproteobacteria bacterium]
MANAADSMKLLIVEDDPGLQSQLRWCFEGYEVLQAKDRPSAMAQVRRHQPPLVTLDLGLPPDPANATEGLALLEEILSAAPNTKVIVVTGNDDRANALKAVAQGAYDFYVKPVDADTLRLIVDRAARLYALEEENRCLARQARSPLEGLITADPGMLKVCRMVERVAPSDATVLLLGDSGTGKEVLARALHQLSPRKKERFVAINCAAIPENLLESELFGHEKGAFTGASKQTLGKLEMADGGTLFLDEIGDLPLPLQAKLLRFLQERVLERVGGREQISVDVRVVSATHQDIEEMMAEKTFRHDLYYRLSDLTIEIPPLRERRTDAVLLANAFAERHKAALNPKLKGVAQSGLESIQAYSWPGNVRELESVIKRAVIMADSNYITDTDLGLKIDEQAIRNLNLREAREKAEKDAIRLALSITQENMSKAAELLGITRPTLYDLMNKYELKS